MTPHPFPRLRLLALVWLAVYLPSYTVAYGLFNFVFLCNLGILLTALGLWLPSRVLISSQALACPAICLAWAIDAASRLLTGAHLFGFTEYMWDPRWPLFTRLLSLYHLGWPVVVFVALRRVGYDRRGLALQSLIAALAIVVGRAGEAEVNVNFAWRDPLLGQQWGPAAVHLLAMAAGLVVLVYLPIDLLLRRRFLVPPVRPRGSG